MQAVSLDSSCCTAHGAALTVPTYFTIKLIAFRSICALHKLAQRLLCILIKVYYSWNSWRKYYYVCVCLPPWSPDPWRLRLILGVTKSADQLELLLMKIMQLQQQLCVNGKDNNYCCRLPAAHVWTCFAVARRKRMREGTAVAAKNFSPFRLRLSPSLWLSVYRWPPRVCLMQLSEAEVILPAACLTDWLNDGLPSGLTDWLLEWIWLLNGMLVATCLQDLSHSFVRLFPVPSVPSVPPANES